MKTFLTAAALLLFLPLMIFSQTFLPAQAGSTGISLMVPEGWSTDERIEEDGTRYFMVTTAAEDMGAGILFAVAPLETLGAAGSREVMDFYAELLRSEVETWDYPAGEYGKTELAGLPVRSAGASVAGEESRIRMYSFVRKRWGYFIMEMYTGPDTESLYGSLVEKLLESMEIANPGPGK